MQKIRGALVSIICILNFVTGLIAAGLGEWNPASYFMSAAVFCLVLDASL